MLGKGARREEDVRRCFCTAVPLGSCDVVAICIWKMI